MEITDRQVSPDLECPIMLVLMLVCEIERIQNTGQSKGSTWTINREKGAASSTFQFCEVHMRLSHHPDREGELEIGT